jgi:hypothetical protein
VNDINQNDTDFPLSGGEEPDFDVVGAAIAMAITIIAIVLFIYIYKH